MPWDLQVQYGLNLRPKAAAEAAPAAEAAGNGATTTRDWELAKFKADMERLPGVSPDPQCTACDNLAGEVPGMQ